MVVLCGDVAGGLVACCWVVRGDLVLPLSTVVDATLNWLGGCHCLGALVAVFTFTLWMWALGCANAVRSVSFPAVQLHIMMITSK